MDACVNCRRNEHHACLRSAGDLSQMFGQMFGRSLYECGCFDASPDLHRTLSSAKASTAKHGGR